MEPITGLIFVLGVVWAMRGAGRAVARANGTHRANASKAATTRGGTHNRAGSARRAARQATLGYWAGEARRGFPVARHGFAQGWREHTEALAERERDTAAHKADTGHRIAQLRAQAAAHQHRLSVIQQRTATPPTMSDQLRATPVRGQAASTVLDPFTTRMPNPVMTGDPHHMGAPGKDCTNPDCSCHASDPPLADGKTAGNGPPATNGQGPATTNGAPVTDFNLDQILATASSARDLADHAVNEEILDRVVTMSDEIGGVVPTDATANGHSGEAAAAVAKIKEGFAELTEASGALHDHMEKTYQPQQEALDDSGQEQPKEGLLQH